MLPCQALYRLLSDCNLARRNLPARAEARRVIPHLANDQGPVVQSALLRGELVRLRKECGLTQEQVASNLEWSPSKLIRVEGGRSSVTKVDLDALMTQYGVTSESQRERLHALNRGARERGWWDTYRDEILSSTYLNYIGYEAGAASIRQFHNIVVPGRLQTPEYAEALTAKAVTPAKVAPVVQIRLARQRSLSQRSVPPRQMYVLDEGVIHRHIGIRKDPMIMPSQLQHVVDLAQADERITVRIIPFSAGETSALVPFTLLEFEGGLPDILYLDAGQEAIVMVTDDSKAANYADLFESLLESALSADDSMALILSAAEYMSLATT